MTADAPLNVLIIGLNYLPEPTGIAPYTTGLARGLVQRGHRVRVVAGFPHYPWWSFADGYARGLRRREVDDGVELVRVRHTLPKNTTGVSRIGMEVVYAAHAASVRDFSPDVVLAVSPALLGVAAALTWKSKRVPVGVISQDLYSRALHETGALGGRGARVAARVEAALFRRVDGVAVIHDLFRDSVVGLGVDPAKVEVIRNWSHIAEPTTDRGEVRTRFGWGESDLVALHAGNIGHKQGLENVVEAARLADSASLPIRFVLLGDGARRSDLQRLGATIQRLEFLDPLPDGQFEDVLSAADVLVLNEKPGISEMCVPGKLTSYFTASRPVVAATDTRSGAAFEVSASAGGVCVESGRPAAMVDALMTMKSDPGTAREMGRRGREYAARVLSAEHALDSYASWIDRLVARAG